jgi:hypothetical protein
MGRGANSGGHAASVLSDRLLPAERPIWTDGFPNRLPNGRAESVFRLVSFLAAFIDRTEHRAQKK